MELVAVEWSIKLSIFFILEPSYLNYIVDNSVCRKLWNTYLTVFIDEYRHPTRNQGGNRATAKFSKTCVVVRYNSKLKSFSPRPKIISWLRLWLALSCVDAKWGVDNFVRESAGDQRWSLRLFAWKHSKHEAQIDCRVKLMRERSESKN